MAEDRHTQLGKLIWSYAENGKILIGTIVFVALLVAGLIGPLVAGDPISQDLRNAYAPPFFVQGGSARHLLGTDSLGRDIYSRLVHSSQAAVYVGVFAAVASGLIGIPIGIIAGYYRGRLEEVIMRIVDMWMSFPPVLLSIALIAVLGVGLQNVVLAVTVVDWTRYARVVRGEVAGLRERDFISAAKALGGSAFHIMRREILPNVTPLLMILVTLEMRIAITVEILLSYVGLGVKAPNPSWGSMIAEGLAYIRTGWWGTVPAIIVAVVVIFALNLLGDGLRERLDPRLSLVR